MSEYLRWGRQVAERFVFHPEGKTWEAERVWGEALRLASRDLVVSTTLERCLGLRERIEAHVVYRSFQSGSCQLRSVRGRQKVWRVWRQPLTRAISGASARVLPPPWPHWLMRMTHRVLKQRRVKQRGALPSTQQLTPSASSRELLYRFPLRLPQPYLQSSLQLLRRIAIRQEGLVTTWDVDRAGVVDSGTVANAIGRSPNAWRPDRWMPAVPPAHWALLEEARNWIYEHELASIWSALLVTTQRSGAEPIFFPPASCVVWHPMPGGRRRYFAVYGLDLRNVKSTHLPTENR